MTAAPLGPFVLSRHAVAELRRRGLTGQLIDQVLKLPEQRLQVRQGREVFQSRIVMGEPGRLYLLRVFVDTNSSPAQVVTAYRTSKIDKYWSSSE